MPQILALKYAENRARTRADSFLFDARPGEPHPMHFYLWAIREGERTIVVDTGFGEQEAAARGRPLNIDPVELLRRCGIDPVAVDTLVLTHLHFDHAGCLDAFPNAMVVLQEAELAFATGAMMTNADLALPYTAAHVAKAVHLVHEGRVRFLDGDGAIAPGISAHLVGGHAKGLQCLTVETARGPVVLASDVAHFYENAVAEKLFKIVVDPEAMVRGFRLVKALAPSLDHLVPGHDALIAALFPPLSDAVPAYRVDLAPRRPVAAALEGSVEP